ncbi:MAG TPA: hypothetical protein PK819_02555, partial [Thermomicrobiales bacterium]|nr:hypothetical protein [Thermomicrobiales bacterium]
MSRLSRAGFVWFIAVLLALTPVLSLAPISAAADTGTEVATVPADDGTPVVPDDTATPEPTATVAEPTATESATLDPTATETAIA